MNSVRETLDAGEPQEHGEAEMTMRIETREELPGDEQAIHEVNASAFHRTDESEIVDELRKHCYGLLSLVAVNQGNIVGHILFSPVSVHGDHGIARGMGLGPMAVLPDYQRRGIGSRLVKDSVTRLRDANCPFLVVLGHPHYYPRFGFKPASCYGIECEWAVPDEAFMVRVLDPTRMKRVKGIARYRPEFGRVGAS